MLYYLQLCVCVCVCVCVCLCYTSSIICPDEPSQYPITFLTVMSKIRLECFMWVSNLCNTCILLCCNLVCMHIHVLYGVGCRNSSWRIASILYGTGRYCKVFMLYNNNNMIPYYVYRSSARLSGREDEDPDYEELEAVLHSEKKVHTWIDSHTFSVKETCDCFHFRTH